MDFSYKYWLSKGCLVKVPSGWIELGLVARQAANGRPKPFWPFFFAIVRGLVHKLIAHLEYCASRKEIKSPGVQAVVVPAKMQIAVQRIRRRHKPKKKIACPTTIRVGRQTFLMRGLLTCLCVRRDPGKMCHQATLSTTVEFVVYWSGAFLISLRNCVFSLPCCPWRLLPSVQECLNKFWSDEATLFVLKSFINMVCCDSQSNATRKFVMQTKALLKISSQ